MQERIAGHGAAGVIFLSFLGILLMDMKSVRMELRPLDRAASALIWSALACVSLHALEISAQVYPSRPVRVVHGYAVGSAIDVFSRPLAQKLSEGLGQQFVIDARPGATGTIGSEIVVKSPPDGYTLLAAPSSALGSTPHLQKLSYDTLRDFEQQRGQRFTL
jgi:tripartite-type tricarboxylate transporter receptor subunit TctC